MHGKTLSQQILLEAKPAIECAVTQTGITPSRFLGRYVDQYRRLFREYAPRAIEEIRGITDGSGLDDALVFFAATRDGAKLPATNTEACTAFYCAPSTTADGHTYLGQTKDTFAPLDRYHIMRRTYDDGVAVLTLNYPGWIANIGMNSHGVACTGNSLYAKPANNDTVPFSLVRYLIAQAESVTRVQQQIERLPMENSCIMIADDHDRAICIENVAGQRDCRDISGEAFGHANSILCPQLASQQELPLSNTTSASRQMNIDRLLNMWRGSLNEALLQAMARDHTDHPKSICLHSTGDQPGTTAAMIADCTARSVSIAIGHPCRHPFQQYSLAL